MAVTCEERDDRGDEVREVVGTHGTWASGFEERKVATEVLMILREVP